MTIHIFLSSTYLDLQPERQAVETVIHRFRETKFVGMEYFGSRDETTQRASLDEVDRSDFYLGIFGGRYGSGITEDEYRRARERNLPCFAYCKQDALIPAQWRETDQGKIVKFAQLMGDLRQHHTVQTFTTPEDLATKVATDLHRWLFDHYLTPRLEQAARGERPRHEANALLNEIKDWDSLSPALLERLKSAGFVVASGQGSVAIGGNVSGSVLNTGNDNFTVTGGINIKGDGVIVGHHSTSHVTKTTTTGLTAADFAALLTQIRAEIPKLPERHRQVAETNLATAEEEAKEPKPDVSIIESSLKTVESLFKKAESIGTAAIGLYPMVTKAVEMARQLFP
jgi:Domain of unknown function (DUF4062)